MDLQSLHGTFKVQSISGRYINLDTILPFLNVLNGKKKLQILGHSVLDQPIYGLKLGSGKTKILMWSQMHGNESTTTKGLIDFLNLLQSDNSVSKLILEHYSFCIVPMLNPDGAEAYTRTNANNVDLNRDFQTLSQPESRLLMHLYEEFQPDFCYNLHDQRTVFGAGDSGQPATISFLAPSYNDERDYNVSRLQSVGLIMKMASVLNTFIPGQIARFDDTYNINCVGDTFQTLGTATILIEAGHFPDDYEREETRKYVFIALLAAFSPEDLNSDHKCTMSEYMSIPENLANFFDVIYRNVRINADNVDLFSSLSVQFKEVLFGNTIIFEGVISKIGDLEHYFGHIEFDAQNALFGNKDDHIPKLDRKANFSLDNNVKIVNGLVKK